MSYRSGVVTGILISLLLAGAGYLGWWLWGNPAMEARKSTPPPIPASVPKPLKEELINTITLTADAESRLALRTAPVERKSMRRTRTFGGEVTIPAGQLIIISAPLSGTLRAPATGVPVPGHVVKQGQPVFELLPILTPEGRANLSSAKVDADSQVKNAETQLEAAGIALTRAKQLLKDEAGSKRQVDEAQAQVDIAQQVVAAAVARRNLFAKVMGEVEQGTTAPITIDSPVAGVLRNISARAGQNVPNGAALFEVMNPDRVWVKVPVYVGDLKDLETTTPAMVGPLSALPGAALQQAQPVDAPPTANANAGTVDLYYELDNRTAKFSPAHRVSVTLQQKDSPESLTVPWSAVVHDIHGGTWVYERVAERTYSRRRVSVRNVQGATAVLNHGPAVGTTIVVAGAAELFGTETGFSK